MARLFDSEPIIQVLPREKAKPFVLTNTVCFQSNGEFCFINKGFTWNGSDIPKILWWIVGSQYDPQFLPASMVHDYMLKEKYQYDKYGVWKTTEAFRKTLIHYEVGELKARVMATAVFLYQLGIKAFYRIKEGLLKVVKK